MPLQKPSRPPTLLTVGGAEAPGCGDHGECGAAVHRPEVVLHVGAHVGVGGVEGGLPSRVRGEADQGDVGDDGAAAQIGRPAGTESSVLRKRTHRGS